METTKTMLVIATKSEENPKGLTLINVADFDAALHAAVEDKPVKATKLAKGE